MLGPSLLALTVLAAPSALDLATADPDAPALELGWRDGLRAKAGGRMRLLGEKDDDPGGLLELHGFIELHNAPGDRSFVPYQFWRGRFAVEGGYAWRFNAASRWTLRVTGAAEHESDHPTSPNFSSAPLIGYVNLNSLAVRAGARHGAVAPTHLALTARLHLLTCTRSPAYCGGGGGTYGDRSFEAELAFTQELSLWGVLTRWNLFASVWGSAVVGSVLVQPGRRLAGRLGAILRRKSDSFSVFLQGFGGTDLGYYRQYDRLQFGVGMAWAPD